MNFLSCFTLLFCVDYCTAQQEIKFLDKRYLIIFRQVILRYLMQIAVIPLVYSDQTNKELY
jgi:hypothetical protein